MRLRLKTVAGVLAWTVVAVASAANGQSGAETFTATATVKTAGGATASTPATIVIDRKMSQAEADKLVAAFTSGGTEALRKALVSVAPTGSIRLGSSKPTATH